MPEVDLSRFHIEIMSETNEVTGLNGYSVPPPVGGVSNSSSPPDIETDLLIVGTGPAGGALSAFLASYGQYFQK